MDFINQDTDDKIKELDAKINDKKMPSIERTPYEKNDEITNYVIFIHYSGPGAMVDGDTHIGTEWFNINRYIRDIS